MSIIKQHKFIKVKLAATLLLALLFSHVTAQKMNKNKINYWPTKGNPSGFSLESYLKSSSQNSTAARTEDFKNKYVAFKVSSNYYTTQTSFFCNQERKLEKNIKTPVKFRLGSVSYTEAMEGY